MMVRKMDGRLSGAYALNALTPDERTGFEVLMAGSESLRAEVTEFTDTAALLAQTVDTIAPPAHLRIRVLAQVAVTPQFATEIPVVAHAPHRVVETLQKITAKFVRPVGYALAGAGAAVILTIGVMGAGHLMPTQPATVTAIEQASDQHTVDRPAGVATNAEILWSHTEQAAAVKLSNNLVPAGGVYQLWVTDATGATRSAGLVVRGNDWTVLHGGLPAHATVRMTVEPAGGSAQPTSKPLFTVNT